MRHRSRIVKTVPTTMTTTNLDTITRKHTAFTSFSELVNAAGNYRPSIYLNKGAYADNLEKTTLAMAYDDTQAARGDERRAFRGNW